MSFAACKIMHCPTGIENCAAGFITHSAADITPQIIHTADVDSDWPATKPIGHIPNLVVSAGNVLEVYLVRVEQASSRDAAEVKRGGLMTGISAASLELVCNYRLHGNIYSMGVLTTGGVDGGRRRDSIILCFEDAKMSVLEFDDATHGLRTR
ncbi:hypothetical protein RND71_030086 [Anisodus tanguticus]|uniref:Uncharacterized protein n=1 Tax=Anisodus tanguticus TaxID=243964 RepID=A0AAE1RFQ9_9SOLA|nr:hypothetical protein RND71_030086 [Anisodus tanguticus]